MHHLWTQRENVGDFVGDSVDSDAEASEPLHEGPLVRTVGLVGRRCHLNANDLAGYDEILSLPRVRDRAGGATDRSTRAAAAEALLREAVATLGDIGSTDRLIAEAMLATTEEYSGNVASRRATLAQLHGVSDDTYRRNQKRVLRKIVSYLQAGPSEAIAPVFPDAVHHLVHLHYWLARLQLISEDQSWPGDTERRAHLAALDFREPHKRMARNALVHFVALSILGRSYRTKMASDRAATSDEQPVELLQPLWILDSLSPLIESELATLRYVVQGTGSVTEDSIATILLQNKAIRPLLTKWDEGLFETDPWVHGEVVVGTPMLDAVAAAIKLLTSSLSEAESLDAVEADHRSMSVFEEFVAAKLAFHLEFYGLSELPKLRTYLQSRFGDEAPFDFSVEVEADEIISLPDGLNIANVFDFSP